MSSFQKMESAYAGAAGRKSAFDVTFAQDHTTDLVIFCHGYKGFKDWGPWNLVAEAFAAAGCDFLKFNFSHNGGTAKNPIDFPDVAAFAKNSYSKELADVECILNRVGEGFEPNSKKRVYKQIFLIGHSRGGGIAILAAAKFLGIHRLITWAAVADFSERFSFDQEEWKTTGVTFVKNVRTGQNLPHHYSFYTDFVTNRQELDIPQKAKTVKIPWLVAHGQDDKLVSYSNADRLNALNPQSRFLLVKGTGHTFGGSHPWGKTSLPPALNDLVIKTINFVKQPISAE